MKGVILSLEPRATFVDLTHGVGAQDVWQGAFALAAATPWFPPGTIHVAVVDPGVGTARAAVVVRTAHGLYVAPDNGLLTLALDRDPPLGAWRLDRPQFFLPRVSRTFHGRDVFAPVAAALASGRPPEEMGSPVDAGDLVHLEVPPVRAEGDHRVATVLYCDHFGNLVTGFRPQDLEGRQVLRVEAGTHSMPLGETYQQVGTGDLVALWGSFGHLEVSRNLGSAAETLTMRNGDPVRVVLEPG